MNPTQEVEDLRYALRWALAYITHHDEPKEGELYKDYRGATRVAWPDEPENWA